MYKNLSLPLQFWLRLHLIVVKVGYFSHRLSLGMFGFIVYCLLNYFDILFNFCFLQCKLFGLLKLTCQDPPKALRWFDSSKRKEAQGGKASYDSSSASTNVHEFVTRKKVMDSFSHCWAGRYRRCHLPTEARKILKSIIFPNNDGACTVETFVQLH